MRMASKIMSLVLVWNLIYFINPAIAASSGPGSPPANFETLKTKISESLIGYRCGDSDSIGFSGNWLITEEDKNFGVNSMIFTPGGSLFKCGRYQSKFDFEYKSKTYPGTVWNSGEGLPDFGSARSSVVIPSIPLWGTTAPSEGSWVVAVNYLSGFGFSWKESKVLAYNPETLIFAINPTVPLVEKNALVFNNKGDFLGVVSKHGVKAIEGGVLVHGAPLQCPLNATQSSSSVTKCSEGVYAQNIWKNSATSPAPDSKQVCVLATPGSGYSDKSNLEEQCTSSDITSWDFGFCSAHPKHELQIYSKKKWIKTKTVTAIKSIETCSNTLNPYDVVIKETKIAKYRVKSYGNSKYETAYMNLTLTLRNNA